MSPPPTPDPLPDVVIKDRPVGPPCSICALPRVIVIEHDLLLCLRCDDFPQRKAVIAALRAELHRRTP